MGPARGVLRGTLRGARGYSGTSGEGGPATHIAGIAHGILDRTDGDLSIGRKVAGPPEPVIFAGN
jgi:hypothetical protein